MKTKKASASKQKEANNHSGSKDQSLLKISDQISLWEKTLSESLDNTRSRHQIELKKLERDLRIFTKSVLNTTRKDIKLISAWRIYLPILCLLLVLSLGLILGSAATLAMNNYALVKKHPIRSELILCQKTVDLDGQPVCIPQ